MIRLLIVDDHHLIRAGIRALLMKADDIEVVAEAANGIEAMNAVRDNSQIDLVLMDLHMPKSSGLTATRRILRAYPQVKIIILTACENDVQPMRVLQVGASGYLTKNIQKETLFDVIRQVTAGKCYLEPQVIGRLVKQRFFGQRIAPFSQLSDREFDIMCDARHGTEFSGESPPWAELKRFTSLDKGKFVRACHEGS
ncbi:MAG: response regulator transcription factor [Gammaproteobacteria bacterium]|nr:response regulator transcription factor [Gammaproteobacteria bacterium]